jgi:hypothetical protein
MKKNFPELYSGALVNRDRLFSDIMHQTSDSLSFSDLNRFQILIALSSPKASAWRVALAMTGTPFL